MVAEPWPEEASRSAPSPGPFAGLLGQPYQRLKVAVLRTLAVLPRSSWSLAEAEQTLRWLDPATSARLLGELREDGLLVQAAAAEAGGSGHQWRLSDEAHLVAAVSAVLAVPRIEPGRVVRVLGSAMALARAVGLDGRAALAPLAAATAVLEADQEELVRRLAAADEPGLLAAARLAAAHVVDMRALLEQAGADAGQLPEARRAADAAERLGALAAEVEARLAGDGDAGPAAPDAADLRAMVAGTDLDVLAGMVAGQLRLPPAVPPVRATAALAALEEHLGRPEPVAVPLPEPRELPLEPPEAIPDFVQVAADALAWLGGLGDSDLAKWVVGGTWQEAAARMAAVVEAWSRWGPGGDGSLPASLEPEPAFEVVGRDEVGVVTRTGVRSPNGAAPAPSAERAEPAEVGS
ncbi:MAG TPA: hypothetical protein VFD04_05180 [Actinomycetes bacterium]|nr:hypothetical protein [Actinomycetes bacterium]